MRRLGSAIRLMLCLPPVWFALVALGLAFAYNGWDPVYDILLFAFYRLFG